MRRISWIVAVVILLGGLGAGCGKGTGPDSMQLAPNRPFTNQELAEELRRGGVARGAGIGVDGPEIMETPRGLVVSMPNTFFAFDKADLDAGGLPVLDKMAKVLNNPRAATRKIKLEGHTDNVGSAAYNMTLSKNRADAVAKELAKQGLTADRISVEGFGGTRPVAPNRKADGTDDPEGRAKNRRVEAIISQ
jgi:outer membrane protein OmpA-like peptidoglycan-associated protein